MCHQPMQLHQVRVSDRSLGSDVVDEDEKDEGVMAVEESLMIIWAGLVDGSSYYRVLGKLPHGNFS
jgi:hypothetical protein